MAPSSPCPWVRSPSASWRCGSWTSPSPTSTPRRCRCRTRARCGTAGCSPPSSGRLPGLPVPPRLGVRPPLRGAGGRLLRPLPGRLGPLHPGSLALGDGGAVGSRLRRLPADQPRLALLVGGGLELVRPAHRVHPGGVDERLHLLLRGGGRRHPADRRGVHGDRRFPAEADRGSGPCLSLRLGSRGWPGIWSPPTGRRSPSCEPLPSGERSTASPSTCAPAGLVYPR